MYKKLNEVAIQVNPKVGLTEEQRAVVRQHAVDCDAMCLHDFVVSFNEADYGFTIEGDDVKGILDKFETDVQTVKTLVNADQAIPEELSIFVGKFTKVEVKPIGDIGKIG